MRLKRMSDRKKDIICNILFIIFYFIIIRIITHNGKFILGSTTDFSTQHYIIPEYFRTLFYENYDLLPDFAFNLGAGENIYYLSYYGLLNPIILISYLFPMIDMLNYIIISMHIIVLLSVSLFYFYLRKNKYSHTVSFIGAFLLLTSAPFIFHSHRHIMFISYMPFLIMGLYGIDNYINKSKSSLLIISSLLMIFTSYYYSISGFFVLFVLGIYKYMKLGNYKIKNITMYGLKLIPKFIISILISSILILPTFYTLLNGRSGKATSIGIKELLKPHMYMLYNNYGIGLTAISLIVVIIMCFSKKKENKVLSILILLFSIFPVFNYILNGFLYINSKTLIPFIPLVLIIVCELLNSNIKVSRNLIYTYIIISSFCICIVNNFTDILMSKKDLNKNYSNNIDNIIYNDNLYRINTSFLDKTYINKVYNHQEYKTSIYSSTSNKYYKNVYKDLFNNPLLYRNRFMISSSENILFQMYMGEKYIVTDREHDSIYKNIDSDNLVNIYRNDFVLPIGYATDRIINEKDFDKLLYPTNVINMMGRVIIDKDTNTVIKEIDNTDINYHIDTFYNLDYKKTDKGYIVDAKEDAKIDIKVDEDLKNKLVFISFDILKNQSCKKGDLAISVNGIKNKLTCRSWKYSNENSRFDYTIVSNKDNKLEVIFDKGLYNIGNIKIYSVNFDILKDFNKNISPFIIDKGKTKGDNIIGDINVLNDSYFTLSIPYDKGFNIFVDGVKVNYEKVNKAFIGFKLNKGKHHLEIEYKAPYKDISIIISLFGILLFIFNYVYERRNKNGFNNSNSSLL